MSSEYNRKASQLAEKLLSNYDIRIESAIPVEEIAVGMGIKVSRRNLLKDVEGGANTEDGKAEIILGKTQNKYRERFTIAHEIGHLLLDNSIVGGPKTPDISFSSEGEIEDFCHKFASHLLIPKDSIRNLLGWGNVTIQDVADRGHELKVNLEPIMRRVLEENPGDGGFLLFKRTPGVNVERPFVLNRGVFPSSNTRSIKDKGNSVIIPYISKYFNQLVRAYKTNSECLLHDMNLELESYFPGKGSIRTAVMAKAHNNQLVLVVVPPEVDVQELKHSDTERADEYQITDISSFE